MDTKEHICETLLSMIEEQTWESIKVTKLCERAGISRSTFYAHFDSVDNVLESIEIDFFKGVENSSNLIANPANPAAQKRLYEHWRTILKTFKILSSPNGDAMFIKKLEKNNRDSLNTLQGRSYSSRHPDKIRVIEAFLQGGKTSAFQWWAEHENEISLNDFASIMTALVTAVHSTMNER